MKSQRQVTCFQILYFWFLENLKDFSQEVFKSNYFRISIKNYLLLGKLVAVLGNVVQILLCKAN